jgi:hypothetical protein
LKASLELVRISLKIDPEMMTVQDNRNDTALHKAVTLASTSNYEDVASLAICMCKSVPEDTIRKALSVTNYRGETSIHIAVVKQLEIASMLIQRADQMTLLMQRNSESNGIPIVGGGNTALHDAVAYERCLSEESNCTENELCQICAEIHEQMWDKRNSVLELLEMLMCRAPSALTITNSADESPYLYHQSTKIRQQDPSTQPGKLSSRTAGNKLTAKTETATRVAYSVSSHIQDADSQPTTATKKPGTAGRDNTEKGKGLSTATSGASTAPKVTDRVIAPSESGSCPAPVRSDRIATEVEGYLLERAFTLGGFKEACKCFFGKKRGKDL